MCFKLREKVDKGYELVKQIDSFKGQWEDILRDLDLRYHQLPQFIDSEFSRFYTEHPEMKRDTEIDSQIKSRILGKYQEFIKQKVEEAHEGIGRVNLLKEITSCLYSSH